MRRLLGRKDINLEGSDRRTEIEKQIRDTKIISIVHGAGLVGFGIAAVYSNQPAAVVWTVLNVAVNVYPILLQRYNFLRLGRALERINRNDKRD